MSKQTSFASDSSEYIEQWCAFTMRAYYVSMLAWNIEKRFR